MKIKNNNALSEMVLSFMYEPAKQTYSLVCWYIISLAILFGGSFFKHPLPCITYFFILNYSGKYKPISF